MTTRKIGHHLSRYLNVYATRTNSYGIAGLSGLILSGASAPVTILSLCWWNHLWGISEQFLGLNTLNESEFGILDTKILLNKVISFERWDVKLLNITLDIQPQHFNVAEVGDDNIQRNRPMGSFTHFVNVLDLVADSVPLGK